MIEGIPQYKQVGMNYIKFQALMLLEENPNNILVLNKRYENKICPQAVTEMWISNENIKFEKLNPVKAVCVYHKGAYDNLRELYDFLIKWVEENEYEIAEPIRERYIDGTWNKSSEDDWLNEIKIPIRKK